MKTRMHRRFVLAVASAVLVSGVALAAEAVLPTPVDPSPEQRHKMAEIHQRMADCLVSARPIAECRGEMQKSCHEMMGKAGCSMMDGGMGSGMMGGGMMQGQGMGETPAAPSQKTPSSDPEEHGH